MRTSRGLIWLVLFLGLIVSSAVHAQASAEGEALLTELAETPNARKGEVINAIVASGEPRARVWLEAFGDNKLSRVKDSGQFVIVLENRGRDWKVEDALTGEALGEMSRRDLDNIRINNALRNELASIMAIIDLKVDDTDLRLAAARELRGSVDSTLAERLRPLLAEEQDSGVREALQQAIAIYEVEENGDVESVNVLAGSLNPESRAALNTAVRSDDPALVAAAEDALASIEQKLKYNRVAETLYFGLALGSVLVLAKPG